MKDGMIQWITTEILPHEFGVRRWLAGNRSVAGQEDDLIQEAYCRIARGADPTQISSGRAYFFQVIRNLLIEQIRHHRVVRIDAMAELESLIVIDEMPDAERTVVGRQQLLHVQHLIESLPPRCREVFKARRIEGLSQLQTAVKLGLSENTVRKEVAQGLNLILSWLTKPDKFANPMISTISVGHAQTSEQRKNR